VGLGLVTTAVGVAAYRAQTRLDDEEPLERAA